MNISGIINDITRMINSIQTPANILPPTFLHCTSLLRPGLSAYRITSNIIQQNKNVGIPVGENKDGSMNLINAYTYNVVKSIVDDIKQNGVIQSVSPEKSVLIESTGANAGGPFVAVGYNKLSFLSRGIMQ